jgi:hypothetical protein
MKRLLYHNAVILSDPAPEFVEGEGESKDPRLLFGRIVAIQSCRISQ